MRGDDGEIRDNAMIVLAGAVIIGLLVLIGLIIANTSPDDGEAWLYDLYRGLIKNRTLWILVISLATGAVLTVPLVGLAVVVGLVWWIFLPDSSKQTGAMTRTVYMLYLVGLVVWPVAIVGIVLVYLDKPADGLALSHRRLHVRTFWIGLLYWASCFLVLIVLSLLDLFATALGLVAFVTPLGCLALVVMSAVLLLPMVWTQPPDMLSSPIGWQSIPFAVLLVWSLFWWTKRCVKGLRYLSRQQPYPDPETRLW